MAKAKPAEMLTQLALGYRYINAYAGKKNEGWKLAILESDGMHIIPCLSEDDKDYRMSVMQELPTYIKPETKEDEKLHKELFIYKLEGGKK